MCITFIEVHGQQQQGILRRKVKISNVDILTFRSDRVTTSAKGEPISQLRCVSDCLGEILQARCKNDGTDDMGNVNWRCTAPIPKGCRFGGTNVNCERFPETDPNEGWIVPGSCAFIYGLRCDRLNEAERSEVEMKANILKDRKRLQRLMYDEIERSQSQAARDACELTASGALYPIGAYVSYDGRIGSVKRIACDGTYAVLFENGDEISELSESSLSPRVDPLYEKVTVASPRPPPKSSRSYDAPRTSTYSDGYTGSGDGLANDPFFLCVVLLLLLVAVAVCRSTSSSSST